MSELCSKFQNLVLNTEGGGFAATGTVLHCYMVKYMYISFKGT